MIVLCVRGLGWPLLGAVEGRGVVSTCLRRVVVGASEVPARRGPAVRGALEPHVSMDNNLTHSNVQIQLDSEHLKYSSYIISFLLLNLKC